MFALGQIKLSYQLNGHMRKDIFNFCFISIVNRVLQIVSTCLKSFLYCFAFFFVFVPPIQTVSFYSRESFASSTHMLFDRRIIRQESVYVICALETRGSMLSEEKQFRTNVEYLLLSFFPDRFLQFFFFYFFGERARVC